jgi:hypothetical protein
MASAVAADVPVFSDGACSLPRTFHDPTIIGIVLHDFKDLRRLHTFRATSDEFLSLFEVRDEAWNCLA